MLNKLLARKKLIIFILIVLAGSGYFYYRYAQNTADATSYILSSVEKQTVIAGVSGTGQVSSSDEVELQAKASGDLVYLNAVIGQKVLKGALIAQLDAGDALKTIRDAQANLESAQISLEKLTQPTDNLSLLQAENALEQAEEAKQTAEDNIIKGYEEAFNDIADTFLDLPNIITGLYNVLYSYEISDDEISVSNQNNTSALMSSTYETQKNKIVQNQEKAEADYKIAEDVYNPNFQAYKASNRGSSQETIEELLNQTIENLKTISQAAKSESNYLDTWVDARAKANKTTFTQVTTYQNNLASFISKINSHLSTLLNQQSSLKENQDAVIGAERTIEEKTESLKNLQAGTDELDLKSQQLSIRQKQNSLADAKEKLADYYIRAPFDGVIAAVNVKKGDSLSSGTSVATLITEQHLAEISLNEVDATKVKVGQKATLTFDAASELSLTGEVSSIDSIGAVSQGVVSYGAKINFDTKDERIKPGMSVSVSIIIDSKVDVLAVPVSAVKTQGETSYVEILVNNEPQKKEVTTGLANDTFIEIIEGLNEGDQIITSSVNSAAKSSTTANKQNAGPDAGGMMMLR